MGQSMGIKDIYTDKQIEISRKLKSKDWFICVLHGAKRSGKTILNNDLFLKELIRVRGIADRLNIKTPQYILAGVSSKTIQNNILQELYNRYGITVKFDKHNSFMLFGVKVVQAYTGTITGRDAIRGMTSFGAYVNEASLANEAVFNEIKSRCSGEGARILCDTNPDHPEHWLKKEYIDNDEVLDFHFKLEDNTFLTKRYLDNIKATTPSGMFYDRDIKGLWTIGEGAVYSDFDQNKHYVKEVPSFERYFGGIDWGYEHYGCIAIFGVDSKGHRYLIDGVAAKHKDIDYWSEQAARLVNKYNARMPLYCDSARPEHVDRLYSDGLEVYNADKSVLSGIEQVAKGFKNDSLFIVRDAIPRFADEIYQYVWDKKTGMPIKMNDDVMDAVRYAIYSDYKNMSEVITFTKGGI